MPSTDHSPVSALTRTGTGNCSVTPHILEQSQPVFSHYAANSALFHPRLAILTVRLGKSSIRWMPCGMTISPKSTNLRYRPLSWVM